VSAARRGADVPLRCAILDDYQSVALNCADWGSLAGEVETVAFAEHVTDPGRLAAMLAPFHIVVAMRERTALTGALLARLPTLRLLVTTGWNNTAIDFAAAAELGIEACGTGGTANGTPELTWALILALARHLPLETAMLRSGGPWQSTLGTELAGKRLGLIGLGLVGGKVARVGAALDMEVVAWSANLTAARCAEVGAAHAGSLDLLLQTSDIVSIHLVLSDRTRGLIDRDRLGRMRPGAWLINTSRGPIVDEAALVDALAARRIAGAGLDVFDAEPLPPGHPFRTLPNVVATPHLGAATHECYAVFYGEAVANIRAWLDGDTVRRIGPKMGHKGAGRD
jgi:phosphoglycerate dehydrogenase-like enzyme